MDRHNRFIDHDDRKRRSAHSSRQRPISTHSHSRRSEKEHLPSEYYLPEYKEEMSVRRSSRARSSSRASVRSGRSRQPVSRYIENSVVAFEEFGEAPTSLKLYEFRDKIRTSEKLRKNVVIKIEVSFRLILEVD